jgi:hypothetical protein
LGYLTFLSAIGGGVYWGLFFIRQKYFNKTQRLPVILFGLVMCLFSLGFFSLHFCGFHAGHSVFLQRFFPVRGIPADGFGKAFVNPPFLWVLVFQHLIRPYGFFLIPAIIAERQYIFLPLIKAIKTVQTETASNKLVIDGKIEKRCINAAQMYLVIRPYINIFRMHLLLFFFAFCYFLKIDSFLVYAVVYSVYFFPWSEMKKLKTSNKPESGVARSPGTDR